MVQEVKPMANRLREYRMRTGATQRGLARACGLFSSSVRIYELGKSAPNVYTALRLARALNTTVEELFGGEVDV